VTGREPAIRVLLAKPGLDGHDRGIKVLAMALRDAGAEVIYLGLRRTAAEIAAAAVQEDAQLVGLSVLSGVHLQVTQDVIDELRAVGGASIPVVVGGTIPAEDVPVLLTMGAAGVWPVGSALDDVVTSTLAVASGGGAA
jgi:methylmalonyl-CoA mutase, C-terminal domain